MILLRKFRENAGLTQAQLAEMSGISLRSVVRYEHGQNVNIGKLLKLAAALNSTPNDLLGIEVKS